MESSIRCTLPSISSLLGLADAGSLTNESSPTYSPCLDAASRRHPVFTGESRPGSGYGPKSFLYPPRGFPPSPPLGSDAPLGLQSPISETAPQFSPSNEPVSSGYYHETTLRLESDVQRQHHHLAPLPRMDRFLRILGRRLPPQPANPLQANFPPSSAAAPQPQLLASTAAPPPSHAPAPGMVRQSAFSQSFLPVNMPSQSHSATISWQHHYSLHRASDQLFLQDRYICQTCNKSFRRPSSLRIHSHSHTGEKPFKCSQAGCGRAFSVRSNMRRHEKSCHSGGMLV